MGSGTTWALLLAVFFAAVVEFVEALTIVLAMGITRGWRSALAGTAAAVVALAAFTAAAGYAITRWLPESALQLTIGTLLLIFGLQWLRKGILRSSGRKSMHDEAQIFDKQQQAAAAAQAESRFGLDWFGFVVSFKGVFLEGVEIVFIVITFGLNAHRVPEAAAAAAVAGLVVISAGALARRPLTEVPENTLKFGVGLLLSTFGTFWAAEGLGLFAKSGQSFAWPGKDWALLVVLAIWVAVSRLLVLAFRRRAGQAEAAVETVSVIKES
jgi:Ca2+/H+ antiporter, TMEM165/GDT1 family